MVDTVLLSPVLPLKSIFFFASLTTFRAHRVTPLNSKPLSTLSANLKTFYHFTNSLSLTLTPY